MGTDARGENVEISRNKEKSEQKKKSNIDNLNQKVCGTLSELQQVQVVLLFVVVPEFFFLIWDILLVKEGISISLP